MSLPQDILWCHPPQEIGAIAIPGSRPHISTGVDMDSIHKPINFLNPGVSYLIMLRLPVLSYH